MPSIPGGCGSLESLDCTDFSQVLLWEGVIVLKGLILHNWLI